MCEILDRVLELFYEYPNKAFTIRDIAKKTKIPKSTVHKYVKELKTNNLVTDDNQASNSDFFKIKKTHHYIEKLMNSGFIDYLEKELNPDAIILFGSFRKGESDYDSDIDIFIESDIKKEIKIKSFEKKLNHKIQLFVETDIHKLPDRLFNNVINGIKLRGFVKIK